MRNSNQKSYDLAPQQEHTQRGDQDQPTQKNDLSQQTGRSEQQPPQQQQPRLHLRRDPINFLRAAHHGGVAKPSTSAVTLASSSSSPPPPPPPDVAMKAGVDAEEDVASLAWASVSQALSHPPLASDVLDESFAPRTGWDFEARWFEVNAHGVCLSATRCNWRTGNRSISLSGRESSSLSGQIPQSSLDSAHTTHTFPTTHA